MSYWGVSWAGAWGQSWGPLHEVAETWDTAQGVARNLARNLKFTRVEDAVATPHVINTTISGANPTRCSGNSYNRPTPSLAHSGARRAFSSGEVTANAYIVPKRSGATADRPVRALAHGNGYLRPAATGSSAGYKLPRVSAGAEARPNPCTSFYYKKSTVLATGVHNPTDEQVAVLITLLTKKRSQYIKHQLNRR